MMIELGKTYTTKTGLIVTPLDIDFNGKALCTYTTNWDDYKEKHVGFWELNGLPPNAHLFDSDHLILEEIK